MFRSLRKNLRLASDSADKIKRLDEQTKKASEKLKKQGAKMDELKSAVTRNSDDVRVLARATESLQVLCGKVAAAQMATRPPGTPFSEVEFKVFSQWGEDGIIQHLVHHLQPASKTFVEFGVETYVEANTRFLLINDNWRGLVIDGSEDNLSRLRQTEIYWKHDLTAVTSFVTPGNINSILSANKFGPHLGILSVDIDGMDYWVLKAIEATADILICEYNSVFGPEARVTVPPNDAFYRTDAHHSNLFYGMSLGAAADLASAKGYDLVGVNSAGNNAFFVNRKLNSPFKPVAPEQCFVAAKFRESRSASGELTYLSFEDRQKEIGGCAVYDLKTDKVRPLREVL